MTDDPLSNVLELVGVRSSVAGGFVAGGRWAIRFPPPHQIKFFVVARGECWLQLDGDASPVRFREGDVFLLVEARAYLMATDLDVTPTDPSIAFADRGRGLHHVGHGEDFLILGGHVLFDSSHAWFLRECLPRSRHLPGDSAEAGVLKGLIHLLVEEHRTDRPGAAFASTQLAQLMFLQILRGVVAEGEPGMASRLRVLTDHRLSPALRRMHAEPGRPWQLDELARIAGMSRTAFAVYFKSVAGVAPLTYLTEWRMRLAERELSRSDASLAELASSLGYASESAFSTAFKRVTGVSPKSYRLNARRRGPPGGEAMLLV
ncbi:AraC family transcriptional regulator [Cystobacter fuscus]|uniref:AraC family transcriptional regulator n=1 Tax=Cystobacter fuscus TaxID=43 RepID=UPI002B29AEDD|nr:AraC family transcriptional regulator [Cystobacter fuscus]